MDILIRFQSWVVWLGTFSAIVLGWFSAKNDEELPDFILKNKKTIIFLLGFISLFATLNNPTNRIGF